MVSANFHLPIISLYFFKIFLVLKQITLTNLIPNLHLIPLFTPISRMYMYVPGHANYEHMPDF